MRDKYLFKTPRKVNMEPLNAFYDKETRQLMRFRTSGDFERFFEDPNIPLAFKLVMRGWCAQGNNEGLMEYSAPLRDKLTEMLLDEYNGQVYFPETRPFRSMVRPVSQSELSKILDKAKTEFKDSIARMRQNECNGFDQNVNAESLLYILNKSIIDGLLDEHGLESDFHRTYAPEIRAVTAGLACPR
ncbi:hypothetical protein KY328_03680 [Candidatus Woesearchaeota archaeon]|nr:hypothetical protein [Candidatus Woesearchaeota archaeon]